MRTNPTFNDAFAVLVTALDLGTVDGGLQTKLLACFNRAYARAYNLRTWEDAWRGQMVTPSSALIDFAVLGDARRFEVWTKDPRVIENCALPLHYQTDALGIHLQENWSSVFVLSLPSAPKFTTTAWVTATAYVAGQNRLLPDGNCYQCVRDHTSNVDYTVDVAAGKWLLEPVLAVLSEFTAAYARGTYLIENGQAATGAAARQDALLELETLAQTEFYRVQTMPWRPHC